MIILNNFNENFLKIEKNFYSFVESKNIYDKV